MFKFQLKRKFDRLYREMIFFEAVTEDNWPEYKAIHIEGLLVACMVDFGSSWQMAYLQVLRLVKAKREFYLEHMPIEFYADLVATLKDSVNERQRPQ